MQWSDVLADPSLHDLPYKIELNEHGSIVMTPASNSHGQMEYDLARAIDNATESGSVMVECSIETDLGVKVADIVWRSDDFLSRHGQTTPYPAAPELCIEIVSPSDSRRQLEENRDQYFSRGAVEVWFCHEDGRIEYFAPSGAIDSSALIPGFSFTP